MIMSCFMIKNVSEKVKWNASQDVIQHTTTRIEEYWVFPCVYQRYSDGNALWVRNKKAREWKMRCSSNAGGPNSALRPQASGKPASKGPLHWSCRNTYWMSTSLTSLYWVKSIYETTIKSMISAMKMKSMNQWNTWTRVSTNSFGNIINNRIFVLNCS